MKDYSLTGKEAEKFILYFNETEEELIIHYASGEVEIRKNTSKNRRNILKKMEKQVENAKKFKKNTKKEIKRNDKWKKIGIANVVFVGICSTSLFFGVSFGIVHLCWGIEAIGGLISIVWSALDNAKCKEKLKDLEKHEMYLEFSKIREKEASRILGEVREELKEKGATKKQIEEIPKTLENLDDEININTVHKMEYLEMKQLLENAKALKNIEFFSQTEQEKTEEKEMERTF